MKVKELKEILKNWDDEAEIWVSVRDGEEVDYLNLVEENEFHFPNGKKDMDELILTAV